MRKKILLLLAVMLVTVVSVCMVATATGELSVSDTIMAGNVTLSNASTYPWTAEEYEGITIAKPGNSGVASSSSTLTFTVSGKGVFAFGCSTSTETKYDKFIVSLDGTAVHTLSGVNEWQKLTVPVDSDGDHTITIAYTKDSSVDKNDDTCYVGDIAFCEYAAESDFTFDSSTGTITKYNGSAETVAIPSSIDGVEVKCIGDESVTSSSKGAFSSKSVKAVVIPNGVTMLGRYTFYNCKNLCSITIPSSVTIIRSYAFYKCSGLTSITIPSSVTSIDNYAFYCCSSLISVTIPSSVTSIGMSVFKNCSNLMNIIVSDDNTTYKSVDGVLYNKELTTIYVYPSARTGEFIIPSSVTSIGNLAFSYCSGLTDITIPSSVTSIGSDILRGVSNATIYCYKGSTADNASLYPSSCTISYLDDETTTENAVYIQPVSPDAIEQDGKNVIDYNTYKDTTFTVNLNLSNVENTSGISNYTFFVTYDPTVVKMTGVAPCNNKDDYATYRAIDDNGDITDNIFYRTATINKSIGLKPESDSMDYADVAADGATTCAELGKVKFADFTDCQDPDNSKQLASVKKSGILVGLNFEVIGRGDSKIAVDVTSSRVDGFNSSPNVSVELTSVALAGNIIIGDVTNMQYTITYNANGGDNAPSSVTADYGVSSTISSVAPQREGYDFVGWAETSDATTATYAAGAIYSSNKNITLYAVWKDATYTIKYNPNGGFGTPASVTKGYNEVITLTYDCPQRLNYTFKGWATTSVATEPEYLAGAEYSANESCTLYAVWQSDTAETYTVTYDANGGTNAPDAQTKNKGTNLILSEQKPERDGYRFMGWATSKTSSTVKYDAGDQYTTDASIILYAVWYENISDNITYPSVETKDASSITQNSALLTAAIKSNGGGTIKSARFVYRAKNNVGAIRSIDAAISGDTISAVVSNLTADTDYIYYAVIVNERGSSSGSDKEFKTSASDDPNVVTSIKLSPDALALAVGEKTDLVVSVLPATADDESKQYIWKSSNTDVVKVNPLSKTGSIEAVGEGEAVISVTVASSKAKASCKIVVSQADDMSDMYNFSELNMAAAMTKANNGWSTVLGDGGNLQMATAYLTRWSGLLNENKFPYTNVAKYTGSSYTSDVELNADFHIQDIMYLPLREDSLDNNEIKYAVMNYGAVYASIQYSSAQINNRPTYLCNTTKVDTSRKTKGGHVVTIVGWDDNFWTEEFKIPSSKKGAFICKNSYGTDEGKNGYIYVSYYDANIGIKERCAVFYGIESKDNYKKVYQYDPLGPVAVMDFNSLGDNGSVYVSNVFPKTGKALASDEQLQAISFYTYDMNTRYELFAIPQFTSFDDVSLSEEYKVAEGVQPYAGYHTVNIEKLGKSVALSAGSRFAVIVKLSADDSGSAHYYIESNTKNTAATATPGDGYYSTDGQSWHCLQSATYNSESMECADFCIKAFTNGELDETDDSATTEVSGTADATDVEDMTFEVGSTVVKHFDDSFIFPESFDLREQGLVSSVKDQGSYNTCWSFAAISSIESCALRKYKLASAGNKGLDGAGDGLSEVAVGGIEIEKYTDRIVMAVDEGLQLNYEVEPFNANVDGIIWESDDPTIASIDNQGYLKAYNVGSTRIRVTTADGLYNAEREVVVTTGSPVTGISFDDDVEQKDVELGDVFLLDYTISPEDAANKNVTWSTSNSSVVTVTKYGIIKAVGEGSAVVTCTTENGGFSDSMTINVGDGWSCTLTQKSNTMVNKTAKDFMMGSLTVTVDNETDSTVNGVAILSIYDAEGRPVYTETKDVAIDEGTSEIGYSDVYVDTSSCATYKLVVWSGIDDMTPLCKELEGTIN